MNKFTRAFVATAIIATTSLAFGTAHADDKKAPPAGSCSYGGYWFPDGSKLTRGDGSVALCVGGTWIGIGGKPVSAPKSPIGSLSSIFAR